MIGLKDYNYTTLKVTINFTRTVDQYHILKLFKMIFKIGQLFLMVSLQWNNIIKGVSDQ